MKLSIISAGLSAALIDNSGGTKSTEALMRFEHHLPILMVPKGTYTPADIPANRRFATFKALRKELQRELAEQYFGTHDAFNVSDYDLVVAPNGQSQRLTVHKHDIEGECNPQWDWQSSQWIANLADIRPAQFEITTDDIKASKEIAATLSIRTGDVFGHRPIEPTASPKQHKIGSRKQRFTDAMKWVETYGSQAVIQWHSRLESQERLPTITFTSQEVECVLLNVPKSRHIFTGTHFVAFEKIPFKVPLKVTDPKGADECDSGDKMSGDEHAQHTSELVRATIEAPASALKANRAVLEVSIRADGRDHSGPPVGDSLCMRLIGDVTF